MKIIYLMGKSACGKDTIFKRLKEELNIKSYIPYTTRPMREGESEGVEYFFLSDEEMKEYIDGKREDTVLEYRQYNVVDGIWTYATIYDEQFKTGEDLITIGTLESYVMLKKFFDKSSKEDLIPVYIEVPNEIRRERAIERENMQKVPKFAEMERRFKADEIDFTEEKIEEAGIKKNNRFLNMDLEKTVNSIKEYVLEEEKTID